MKYVFLLNSFCLGKNTEKVKQVIQDVCISKNMDFLIEVNNESYSMEDILKKYHDTSYVLFPVGGDGTIHRVLNGIVGTNNCLGVIPYGTGNDFYRTNIELFDSGIHEIDLVRINDSYFLNVACFGLDAKIGNHSSIVHNRFIPKKQRYHMSVLSNLFRYRARHFLVSLNDEVIESDFSTIVVCNARYYGGGFKVSPHSSLTDGLLDVYLVDDGSKFDFVQLALGMKYAFHEKSKKVRFIQTKSLTITSPIVVDINVDGEVLEDNHFTINIVPKGISLYYDSSFVEDILRR